jgi:hypothetical protein
MQQKNVPHQHPDLFSLPCRIRSVSTQFYLSGRKQNKLIPKTWPWCESKPWSLLCRYKPSTPEKRVQAFSPWKRNPFMRKWRLCEPVVSLLPSGRCNDIIQGEKSETNHLLGNTKEHVIWTTEWQKLSPGKYFVPTKLINLCLVMVTSLERIWCCLGGWVCILLQGCQLRVALHE